MRVAISQRHLSLSEKLAKESNKLSGKFNSKNYSRIENIESMLLKRDISVEKKKSILIKKLYDSIVKTFSIDRKKFNKKAFESFKRRLHNLRELIIKLRSVNYYLETTFLEDLRLSKIKISGNNKKLERQDALAGNELEALEYTAYKLIGEVVLLDKKLLSEYTHKEENALKKEKIEVKGLGLILKKESSLLEHLEAKLPPPKAATISLLKEPIFTHWVARVFAILSYLEHLYQKEKEIFSRLKKNNAIKAKISRKISHLVKESSKLNRIMEEKYSSMQKLGIDNKLRKELHNLTTIINL